MNRASFDEYIRRFNAQDPTVFDDCLTPDMVMLNGTLELRGAQGMKDHYAKIWSTFDETVHCLRVVSDDDTLAVQMWTHFTALRDDDKSVVGPVKAGESFDFRGVVFYWIENGKFSNIRVAYNSFTHTDLAGKETFLGIPH